MSAKGFTDSDGEKAELIWTVLPNEQLVADKICHILDGRWNLNPRKTQQRMARRYQGLVSDGNSKHIGTIKNRMEAVCKTRGRHQTGIDGWKECWKMMVGKHLSRNTGTIINEHHLRSYNLCMRSVVAYTGEFDEVQLLYNVGLPNTLHESIFFLF